MQRIAIVLGGGDGTRAGGPMPKQFQDLDGKPILLRSIEAMHNGGADRVIVVLHPEFLREWEDILQRLPFPVIEVCGGKSRWHSVKNALLAVCDGNYSPEDLIAVHDGARPLVTTDIIEQGWHEAATSGAAIPAVAVTDSLRIITGSDTSEPVERALYRAVQTPQTFRADILTEAYEAPYNPKFTDDASVVQASGHKIKLYPGNPGNIKITNPSDFKIAETLLSLQ